MKEIECRIGVDLGGTKIEGIAIARDGSVLVRKRLETPRGTGDETYREILEVIRELILEIERATGLRGSVGVGIPGTLSTTTRVVKNANSTSLIGHPLDRDLEEMLQRPVRLQVAGREFSAAPSCSGL